jgi:hypothetical protein
MMVLEDEPVSTRPPASFSVTDVPDRDRKTQVHEQGDLVPRCCTVDGFAAVADHRDGIDVRRVESLTELLVKTMNSMYRVTVLDPFGSEVLVSGGWFSSVQRRAVIAGSSLGGSLLKMGWILKGMRVEFVLPGERIVTSAVQAVEIEEGGALPGPF